MVTAQSADKKKRSLGKVSNETAKRSWGGSGRTRKTSSHNFLHIEPFSIVPFTTLSVDFEQGLFVMKANSEGVRRGERDDFWSESQAEGAFRLCNISRRCEATCSTIESVVNSPMRKTWIEKIQVVGFFFAINHCQDSANQSNCPCCRRTNRILPPFFLHAGILN